MQMTQLETSDVNAIRKLFGEILSKNQAITYKAFLHGKTNFERNHVNSDISDFPNRRTAERFSFFSEVEVGFSLCTLFRDIYAAKLIAKNCYCLDEDDRFEIEFDAQIPLGVVECSDGHVEVTSMCKAVLKVRNVEKRNPYYGMPFDIIAFQLISQND